MSTTRSATCRSTRWTSGCRRRWPGAPARARRARRAPRSARTAPTRSGRSPTPGRRCSTRACATTRSRSCAGSTSRARSRASSAATSARSRRPAPGLEEAQYDDLLNFETSDRFDERQKAALAYAQAIAWNEEDRDGLWGRLHAHFSEAELVELGCFIALTFGQQSWIRLLDIDHHQYLAGTDASMAPGFENAEALEESKASGDYWAKG